MCEGSTAKNPFPSTRPTASASSTSMDAGPDQPSDLIDDSTGPSMTSDPTLGGPCVDDAQCDDGVDCTFDRCDPLLDRCRSVPDDASCQDGVYCNGVEVCSPARGCRPGDVVTCDDKTACTIDRCLEEERSCQHDVRDGDRDGDPDAHCSDTGTDCDDANPYVSGLVAEICGNGIDDDCDQRVDELDCEPPVFDDCAEPLELDASGTTLLSMQAAEPDIGASCSFEGARDIFVEVVVADGPKDVLLSATVGVGNVGLAVFDDCEDASSERACESASQVAGELNEARLLLRNVAEGRHAVALFTDFAPNLELSVAFENPSGEPGGETCGEALSLVPGEPLEVDLYGAESDEQSDCAAGAGDRVYRFSVDEVSDVHVYAASLDGHAVPSLSLRGPSCADERSCVSGDPVELFARGVEPGEYWVRVASEPRGRVSVLVEVDRETPAPSGEKCEAPPVLEVGRVAELDLDDFADDLSLGCLAGARDATQRLTIDQASDVLLLLRLSGYDTGAIGLAPAGACDSREALGCKTGDASPLRLVEHRLLAGDYDVVVESELGSRAELVAFVREASSPIVATTAEDCDTVLDIPLGGGSLQGNSSSAKADFSASCDVGSFSQFGAADHLLRLTLTERRRVFFDMEGTAFPTVLSVRKGPDCPGKEVACASAFDGPRSTLDLILDAGEYYVQVDGYAGAEGQWFLEVFEGPP